MWIINKSYYHTWNIGFVEDDIKDLVSSKKTEVKVHWLKHNFKDRFFADPFILSSDEHTIKVLVEDFPYYDKRGMISLLTVDRKTYALIDKTIVLKQPFHMSYPFILRKDNGEIRVLPEASQSGSLYSYELDRKTSKLINQKELVSEPLLDSTIIKYNNLWWLFCTKRGSASNKDLFVYYSNKPEGPWLTHVGNPVVSDEKVARPAGYFINCGDDLFRLGQKCDNHYGEVIQVTKVNALSTSEYKETFVKSIKAQKDEYSISIHTFNALDDLIVVDGLKKEFRPFSRIVFEIVNFFNKRRR